MEWQLKTSGIVSVRVEHTRSFEGASASFSYATGFLVDERGIVLTNRHVATTGPCTYDLSWANGEVTPATCIYRDPVHDFAFLQYSPSSLRFLQPSAIELCPWLARTGIDIRVCGNDAGEKLSVLSGTIARLDRPAPKYATNSAEYNDANTFYIAAASSTSGGSSGAPVLNSRGQAVALNAGGKRSAASSFYYPLDRPLAVLSLLQRGLPIPRGDLLTVFSHEPMDEAKRLGLTLDSEERLRALFPHETGVLCVEEVLAGGPADPQRKQRNSPLPSPTAAGRSGRSGSFSSTNSSLPSPTRSGHGLEPGDILVSVNGVACTHHLPLEEAVNNTWAVAAAYLSLATALGVRGSVDALVQQADSEVEQPAADVPAHDVTAADLSAPSAPQPPAAQVGPLASPLSNVPVPLQQLLPGAVFTESTALPMASPSMTALRHSALSRLDAGGQQGPGTPLARSADVQGAEVVPVRSGRPVAVPPPGATIVDVTLPEPAPLPPAALAPGATPVRTLQPAMLSPTYHPGLHASPAPLPGEQASLVPATPAQQALRSPLRRAAQPRGRGTGAADATAAQTTGTNDWLAGSAFLPTAVLEDLQRMAGVRQVVMSGILPLSPAAEAVIAAGEACFAQPAAGGESASAAPLRPYDNVLPAHLPLMCVCLHEYMFSRANAVAGDAMAEIEGQQRSSTSPWHAHTGTKSIYCHPALVQSVLEANAAVLQYLSALARGGGAAAEQAEAPGPLTQLRKRVEQSLAAVVLHACLALHIERGGKRLMRAVRVVDLHQTIPSCFLEFSGAILHQLSYMAARNNSLHLNAGCFLSTSGYAFGRADVPGGASVITAVGRSKVTCLQECEAALAALPDGAKTPIRYRLLSEPHRENIAVLTIDRKWHQMAVWQRVHDQWQRRECAPPPSRADLEPQTSRYPVLPGMSPSTAALFRSLVQIEFSVSHMLDAVSSASFIGCGVVISVERGLVLTDRNTVAVPLGDCTLSFAGNSVEVPGRVVFLHPIHNIAVVSYDPQLLGDTDVVAAPLDAVTPLGAGDACDFVGLTSDSRVVNVPPSGSRPGSDVHTARGVGSAPKSQ